MKRIIILIAISLLFTNNIVAQNDFRGAINYHTSNAASEINSKNYNDAANSFQSAIDIFFAEMKKAENQEIFVSTHTEILLVLNYDLLWSLILILEKGTVKNYDYLLEGINTAIQIIASSPFMQRQSLVNGNFTIENLYTAIGTAEYLLGLDGYKETLIEGGLEGRDYLRRIDVAKSYGPDYHPEITPIFSISTKQRILKLNELQR